MDALRVQLPWICGAYGTVSLDAFIFYQVRRGRHVDSKELEPDVLRFVCIALTRMYRTLGILPHLLSFTLTAKVQRLLCPLDMPHTLLQSRLYGAQQLHALTVGASSAPAPVGGDSMTTTLPRRLHAGRTGHGYHHGTGHHRRPQHPADVQPDNACYGATARLLVRVEEPSQSGAHGGSSSNVVIRQGPGMSLADPHIGGAAPVKLSHLQEPLLGERFAGLLQAAPGSRS
jgi:hypothetical protein